MSFIHRIELAGTIGRIDRLFDPWRDSQKPRERDDVWRDTPKSEASLTPG
jgi:hypothetical protein